MPKVHPQKLNTEERCLLARTDRAISRSYKIKTAILYPLLMVFMGMVAFSLARKYLDSRFLVDLALFFQAVFWTAFFLNIRLFGKTAICFFKRGNGAQN
jgi:hypothetical protein